MIISEQDIKRYQANQGYVYLIHAVGTDRYKIGRSVNPVARLEQLKGQAPYPLVIVNDFWTPDAIADEKQLHKTFASNRVHGEWFEYGCLSKPNPIHLLDIEWYRPTALKIFEQLTLSISNLLERPRITPESLHNILFNVSSFDSLTSLIDFHEKIIYPYVMQNRQQANVVLEEQINCLCIGYAHARSKGGKNNAS